MKEDGPFFPWIFERALQLLDILDHPKTPQSIGMGKWISMHRGRSWPVQYSGRRAFQERLRSFRWEVPCNIKKTVLRGLPDVCDPVRWHSHRKQIIWRKSCEQWCGARYNFRLGLDVRGTCGGRRSDFFHTLANFDDLDRTSLWMSLDATSRGPGISIVVMIEL